MDQLIEAGASEIVVLDNFVRGRRENLAQASASGLVRIVEGDIRDRELVRSLTQDIDVVFHQAAIRITQCAEEPRLALEVLVDGTFNVVEAAAAAGVRKVVAASSASIYGLATQFPTTEDHHPYDNDTLYGAAKTYNEGLLRSYHAMTGLDYVALRYFNVYGPRMDVHGLYTEVLIRWMERIAEGTPPLIFGDGSQTMDFVYVEDIARANILAATADATDEVFNVASGVETSLLELAQAAARRDGLRPRGRVRARARREQGLPPAGGHQPRPRGARLRGADVDRGGPRRARRLVARRARGNTGDRRGRIVMQIPFARPYLTGKEGEAVAKVIESGWVSQGPQVQAFEAAFADRVGAADAVATTSCTTALHLALYGLGVSPGDEVIVPSLSFIATANAVWMCGAKPVFADIDPLTYNLDPDSAERAITSRTKAIMPVHQVGLPADMDPLTRDRRAPRRRHRRGRGVRDRRELQGPPGGLVEPDGLLLAASAQGDHHRRGRHHRCPVTSAWASAFGSFASTR